LLAACAPERIPGSTISQGDAGIAFHRELAAAKGAGAAGRVRATNSGASYGGGSSSSTTGRAASIAEIPDLRPGGKACDWFGPAEPGLASVAAPAGWDRTRGVGMEGWFAANCLASGELK
jgi:hypothetical protein